MRGSKWGGDVVRRFFSYVNMSPTGCWNWKSFVNNHGYGRFWTGMVDGKNVAAHRFAFFYWHGPIPDGLVVDHVCNNKKCVRPEHLRAITWRENLDRSPVTTWNRVECLRCGGPLERLYRSPRRGCRPCTNKNNREARARRLARKAVAN